MKAHKSLDFTSLDSVRSCISNACPPPQSSNWHGRRERWFLVGAVSLAGLITALIGVRILRAPRAVASATFNWNFPASSAVDGDGRREWLLPDMTSGWLDLYLSPDRDVSRLHVVNSKNAPFNDRATRTLRVEVYFGDELRQTHFAAFEAPHAQELDVEIGTRADRIRLVVETWSGLGGGLAEVEVL